MNCVPRLLVPNRRLPGRLPSPEEWRFSGVGAEALRVRPLAASLMPRARQDSEAVDVDHGHFVGRHLNRFPVVMSLDKRAPVGRWTPGGCNRWWLERFAKMREDLPDRPRLRHERDQPDVATTPRALERKLLAHPGHQFRPRDSRRVVRAGLLLRVVAVSGAVTIVSVSAGRGLALLTDVCDRECRDGFAQLVVRRKHPVVAMPVLPRRRDELGEPVEKLKRRELDDANYPVYLDWQERFRDRDAVILGIHTPETAAEQKSAAVTTKADRAGFDFPVLIDGTKANWNAWGNSMWPSVYLVDKRGYLRYFWRGELKWQGATGDQWMQERIEELLAEPAAARSND